MSLLPGRVCPAARAVCVRYWWKRRYCGNSGSCRKGVWCAPLWCRTRIWGRVTYTTVMEAPTRSMVWMVPLGWWWRSPQRTASGPFSGHVWLVSMALCGDGRRSCRWFHRRVFMLVGMLVWWSTQRGHVLRARCAAWRRMAVTSRTSGEWLWVMR